MFKTSAQLRVENLALRQQLIVLRRSTPKRLKLTTADRIFWLWLSRVWAGWRSYLVIGKPGRPGLPQEVRDLFRMMIRNNPIGPQDPMSQGCGSTIGDLMLGRQLGGTRPISTSGSCIPAQLVSRAEMTNELACSVAGQAASAQE